MILKTQKSAQSETPRFLETRESQTRRRRWPRPCWTHPESTSWISVSRWIRGSTRGSDDRSMCLNVLEKDMNL